MIKLSSYVNLCICITSFKFLFLKSYLSTDFDVHRNWMAVTFNLPHKAWYFDTTSEWTLDYPPLFAAFELFLALIANQLNIPGALNLVKSIDRNELLVVYQKSTVILSDLLYYIAIFRLCNAIKTLIERSRLKSSAKNSELSSRLNNESQDQTLIEAIFTPNTSSCIALLLILQPGLLMVDHIHFQYNGFLSGVFLLSMTNIIEGNHVVGAFWFSILLNLKHIYLYCAPAFGMYTLTSYCLARDNNLNIILSFLKRTLKLALIVLTVFAITYLPFAEISVLKQITARLFPFKRGLTHAYWAPNLWSLYNTADKILSTIYKDSIVVKFDLDSISRRRIPSSTSGIVQEYEHLYLPIIKPPITFLLVGLFTIPLVLKYFLTTRSRASNYVLFMKGVTLASLTSFVFGWHVHEKAIILTLLPLIAASLVDPKKLRVLFLRLSLAGTYSLFPLLHKPAEYPVKLLVLIIYQFYSSACCKEAYVIEEPNRTSWWKSLRSKLYDWLDRCFIVAVVLVEAYIALIHGRFNYDWNPMAKLNKFQFLPLMMTSNMSALAIVYSYIEMYLDFLSFTGCNNSF